MKFIAKSESSKKLLNIAQMSSSLPVNVIITGETGVGKKILARTILPDVPIFQGKVLILPSHHHEYHFVHGIESVRSCLLSF